MFKEELVNLFGTTDISGLMDKDKVFEQTDITKWVDEQLKDQAVEIKKKVDQKVKEAYDKKLVQVKAVRDADRKQKEERDATRLAKSITVDVTYVDS